MVSSKFAWWVSRNSNWTLNWWLKNIDVCLSVISVFKLCVHFSFFINFRSCFPVVVCRIEVTFSLLFLCIVFFPLNHFTVHLFLSITWYRSFCRTTQENQNKSIIIDCFFCSFNPLLRVYECVDIFPFFSKLSFSFMCMLKLFSHFWLKTKRKCLTFFSVYKSDICIHT